MKSMIVCVMMLLSSTAFAGGACYIDTFSNAHILDCGALGSSFRVTIFDSEGKVIDEKMVTIGGGGGGSDDPSRCTEVTTVSTYTNAATCVVK